jgi:hypothetical protein
MSQHNFHFDDTGALLTTGSGGGGGTVNQGTPGSPAGAWYVSVVGGGNIALVTAGDALKVDGSGVTQPTEDAADGLIGSPIVADAIQIGYKDGSGNLQIPSAVNPFPVTVISGGGSPNVNLIQVGGAPITLGQTTMSASLPVVLASDQSSVPVTVGNFPSTQAVTQSTSPWVVSGTVTANQGTANATPWNENIAQVGGVSFSLGQQLAAVSLPVVLTAAQLSTLTPLSTVTANQGGAWSVTDNVTEWNSVALGSPTAFGTAPSGNVIGVNASLFAGTTGLTTILAGSPPVVCLAVHDPASSGGGGGGSVTQGTIPWVVSGTVTANQGGSWSVSQSGTWTVQQGSAPWSVTFPSPQHVVVDSGIVAATQSGAWSVAVGSFAVSFPSGTNTIGAFLDACSGNPNALNITSSGSPSATLAVLLAVAVSNYNYASVLLSGVITGSVTGGNFTIQGTVDGVNWYNLPVYDPANNFAPVSQPIAFTSFSTNQKIAFSTAGFQPTQIRFNTNSSLVGTGSVEIAVEASTVLLPITTIVAPLPAGSNVIGGVTQSGTWNVANTGTFAVQATQSGTWNIGTLTSITNPVTVVGDAAAGSNVAGNPVLMGGSDYGGTAKAQTLKVDSSGNIYIGNSTLAVTQSGNWSVRLQDGSGNLIASTSNALWTQIQNSTLAVTQSGTWTVQQGGSNWSMNIAQVGGSTVATGGTGIMKVAITDSSGGALSSSVGQLQVTASQSGTWTVGISASQTIAVTNTGTFAVQAAQSGTWTADIKGNSGATLDAAISAGTAPANGLAVLSVYNVTAPAPTTGQSMAQQADQNGNLLVFPGTQFTTGAAWGTGTAQNTLQYPTGTATQGQLNSPDAIIVQLDISNSTFTAGAVTFQGTYDNVNWITIPVAQILNPATFAQLTNPYTFVANSNVPFLIQLQGFISVRAKLTTAITGSSTPLVTPYWATLAEAPLQPVNIALPLPAGTNNIGGVELIDSGGTNKATIKAASTAAAAGDTALVVSQNPLSQAIGLGFIMDSTGVQRAISRATFDTSSSGAATLVAASGSTKIYVLSYKVSVNGATNVNLQSHTTTTNTSGIDFFVANQGSNYDHNPGTWITTTAGEGLDINNSNAIHIAGSVTYCQF